MLITFCGNSIGMFLGSIVSDQKSVAAVTPAVIVPFILFSGFFKNGGNLPAWVGWIQYISPIKYGF
jgi:ABC-type multidrug transport system permease subunit